MPSLDETYGAGTESRRSLRLGASAGVVLAGAVLVAAGSIPMTATVIAAMGIGVPATKAGVVVAGAFVPAVFTVLGSRVGAPATRPSFFAGWALVAAGFGWFWVTVPGTGTVAATAEWSGPLAVYALGAGLVFVGFLTATANATAGATTPTPRAGPPRTDRRTRKTPASDGRAVPTDGGEPDDDLTFLLDEGDDRK